MLEKIRINLDSEETLEISKRDGSSAKVRKLGRLEIITIL